MAPVYIGRRAKIRSGSVVTRAAAVEHHSVVDCGTVVENGTIEKLFAGLGHPYSQGLFRARPRLGATKGTRLKTIAGTVNATISASPSRPNPSSITARAASVA